MTGDLGLFSSFARSHVDKGETMRCDDLGARHRLRLGSLPDPRSGAQLLILMVHPPLVGAGIVMNLAVQHASLEDIT